MKYLKLASVLLISAAFLFSCSDNPVEQEGTGTLSIQAFDAPFPGGADHIYVDIDSVSVHRSTGDGEEDGEWIALQMNDQVEQPMDFLELVNGALAELVNDTLQAGTYSQLRLILGPDNSIVVDGQEYALQTPSGQQSGLKLNLNFEIAPNELVEIYLDFDAGHSVVVQGNGGYLLKPVFHAFKKTVTGSIAGTVTNDSEESVENATVWFVQGDDSVSTITGATGSYFRYLVAGTYNVSVEHPDYSAADTSYEDIEVAEGEDLTGYDFVLTP